MSKSKAIQVSRAKNVKLPAKVKTLAKKLAKAKTLIQSPDDPLQLERMPARGFPVIMRKQVRKDLIQLTLSNKRWYIKEVDKHKNLVAPSTNYVINSTLTKGEGYENWVGTMGVENAAQILQQAGDRGTRVHAAIAHAILHSKIDFDEQYEFLEGRPFTAREFDYIHYWGNWWREFRPVVSQIEFPFFDEAFGYAGTIDFFGAIDDGAIKSFNSRRKDNGLERNGKAVACIADWKTGSEIHDANRLQLAAYMQAVNVDFGLIVRIGAKNKNGFQMEVFERKNGGIFNITSAERVYIDYWKAFQHCLGLFNIFHGDEMPDVVTFNKTFSI